jgi:hypothetical protein
MEDEEGADSLLEMNSAHRDIKATRTLRQQEQWFG